MRMRLLLLSCLLFIGCYTQLSMFQPEVEDEVYSHSVARVRPNLTLYANDGAGSSLSYMSMYNRYFNRGYNPGYNYYDSYYLGGRRMYVPIHNIFVYNPKSNTWEIWVGSTTTTKTPRSFSTNRSSNTSHNTNLNTTRTSSTSTSSASSTASNTSSQTKSARGARVTRRN